MLKEAIEHVQTSAKQPITVSLNDHDFLLVPNDMKSEAYRPATPSTLQIATLTGIVSYLKNSDTDLELWRKDDKYLIYIDNYNRVEVLSPLEAVYMKRRTFVTAMTPSNAFMFDTFMPTERFIVSVMANFVDSNEREDLISFISQMRARLSRDEIDHGVTQNVTVQTGVATIGPAQVPNPVMLQPYTTFPEIEQPIRSYVFRVRQKGAEEPIECAFFPIESNEWKLQATNAIREYFINHPEMNGIPAVIIS